jgi:hypothetical protein
MGPAQADYSPSQGDRRVEPQEQASRRRPKIFEAPGGASRRRARGGNGRQPKTSYSGLRTQARANHTEGSGGQRSAPAGSPSGSMTTLVGSVLSSRWGHRGILPTHPTDAGNTASNIRSTSRLTATYPHTRSDRSLRASKPGDVQDWSSRRDRERTAPTPR